MPDSTRRPVRVAVQIAPRYASGRSPYESIRDTVSELERMGVDVILNRDDFFPRSNQPDDPHYESWTMLAALAEQTQRVQIGALVNCNFCRNPHLQADMARTIDHISAQGAVDGRFLFGTGSGWFERDDDGYGVDPGSVGDRVDTLARSLPVIRRRWATLNPGPTRRIPILIGGGGERMLRIVAEHADIWHSFGDESTLERKSDILASHCDAIGRDPSEIEVSVALRRHPSGDHLDLATADRMRRRGATLFVVSVRGDDDDLARVGEGLEWRDRMNVVARSGDRRLGGDRP